MFADFAGAAGFVIGNRSVAGGALSDEEIRIGVFYSLTQSDQAYARSTRIGLETAEEEQNRTKLLGRTVRLVWADDRGKSEDAEKAGYKLAQQCQ